MSRQKVVNKQKTQLSTRSYAAVKSHNEIYYQMASIIKHIAPHEKSAAKKILRKLIIEKAA